MSKCSSNQTASMDIKFISLTIILVFFFKNSECQQVQFCEIGTMTPRQSSITILTSESQSDINDYSNDNGDCGCIISANNSMSAALHIRSRLTVPREEGNRNEDESCGPYVAISNPRNVIHQCPRPPMQNDTAAYVLHLRAGESVSFHLINQVKDEVRSNFTLTLLYGGVSVVCGQQSQPSSTCPCTNSFYGGRPKTGDTKLADRFVAAIVACVLFLVLCGVVFCIYMILKKRKAKQGTVEGGPTPEKNNIDGSENQAYAGSQKSIIDKPPKPDKLPRTKLSPEKDNTNTSYIRYNSNDALNLSLQLPTGNKTPTGLDSIIGTADVRGSTESGIYSSADLIGPDQMYGPNGTPQRHKPGLPPRTPSKEDLDAMYAKPNKPKPPADYYSNVPGEQSPYAHQPAALPGGPPRSGSQDRLDARRAGSFERLDATPMAQRIPSQDRLNSSRDNAAFVPEQHHGSKQSLSETDV